MQSGTFKALNRRSVHR